MDDRPGYWQQQYDNARPARALLWCAAHRRLVRALLALVLAAAVGLLVWAAREGASVVSPVSNVLVFSSQLLLWGFAFPRQVDEGHARQPARDRPAEL